MYALPVATPVSESLRTEAWRAKYFRICLWIVAILPSTYNAILAMINAQGVPTPRSAAIAAEVGILSLCLIACFLAGGRKRDVAPILLLFFALTQMLLTSLINDTIYPDFFRNMAIIAAFTAVGYRSPPEQVRSIFRVISIIVLGFLLIEMIYMPLYVSIFQPAAYLEASRNVADFSLNDTGLSAGALGYEGRFSFGIFSGPRTSSIFLEQVSLPGFAAVLLIFLLGNWQSIGKLDRLLHVALMLLIVLSNNSRTSSALMVINAVGYLVYPYLPGRLTAAIMPVCLAIAFILVGPTTVTLGSDDMIGRLSVTVAQLMNLDAGEFLAGSLPQAFLSYDSGYTYLIVSSSIWGLLAFWIYVTFAPADRTPAQRRVHWGLAVYVYCWLMIGGTAIFTMKTAALLWLVVGNMVFALGESDRKRPTKTDHRDSGYAAV
ncbi:hypothetical protein [Altericroceibacterium xinjiangense]|uniref:hypothetical protein n=1 Tax=Altericroceibacterium xinjiangense TaxID=762261 RepID=UPI000F7E85B5|nr:hypothetical protein [Altericroceibacterium xinjiangense]